MGPEGEQAWGVQCSRAKQQLGASSRQGARGGEEAGTAREHTGLVREAGGSPLSGPSNPGTLHSEHCRSQARWESRASSVGTTRTLPDLRRRVGHSQRLCR